MALVAVLAGTAFSPVAQAQPEEAKGLFEEGLEDLLAGRFDVACPKLDKSYRLDPLPGALFTTAVCYERWGKLNSAVRRYEDYLETLGSLPAAEREKQAKRAPVAKEKIATLGPQVPTLQVELDDAMPPPGTSIEIDGVALPSTEHGQPQKMDPGSYSVVVRRPGAEPAERVETLKIGDRRALKLAVPPVEEAGQAAADGEPAPHAPDDGDDSGDVMRLSGYAAVGVGAVGVLVGGITGAMVFAKKGDVEDNCVDTVCNIDGKTAADDAATLATVSNIGFVIGVVGLAAGATLILLSPDDDEASAARGWRVQAGASPYGGYASVATSW
jgi:hypothetical protein